MKNIFKTIKNHFKEGVTLMISYKIAVDVGGTSIKAAVINDHQIIDHLIIPTPDNQNELIIDCVIHLVEQFKVQYNLKELNVGISTAGVVNEVNGEIVYAGPTIPNYSGTNFKNVLSPLNAKVHVYNDVNAALLGELSQYNYDYDNIFCLTIGTGIGGAFYSKTGNLYSGERHRANEIGYLLYHPEEGTNFEQRASTTALKSQLSANLNFKNINVPFIFKYAHEGDQEAQKLLNRWGQSVAEGIAQIQIIYDPGLILIGGGISAQQDKLLSFIVPHITTYLPYNYGHAVIQTMQCQNDAALFGAVAKF